MWIYFEAENKRFQAATKSAGGASLESVRPPATAHSCIRARAPIKRHTARQCLFFWVSYMWDTRRYWIN